MTYNQITIEKLLENAINPNLLKPNSNLIQLIGNVKEVSIETIKGERKGEPHSEHVCFKLINKSEIYVAFSPITTEIHDVLNILQGFEKNSLEVKIDGKLNLPYIKDEILVYVHKLYIGDLLVYNRYK